ncbi:MAG: D-aminoacyl-tRNA deacylase [Nitrososphaerota archaeon]
MRRVIIISRVDDVSMSVGDVLVESFGFRETGEGRFSRGRVELVYIDEKHIFAEEIGERLKADLVIVPSSHRSEKGVQAFLTHPVGNWTEDSSYGGRPRQLSATSALMLRESLKTLWEESNKLGIDDLDVRLEVTHHGPYTTVPIIFIEVGGSFEKIVSRREIEVVAAASLKTAEIELHRIENTAIGFGGGHYAPSFTKIVLEGDYLVGHMCPKYALPITLEQIKQAVERTYEKPRIALIDWKGITSNNRKELVSQLESLNLEIIKI